MDLKSIHHAARDEYTGQKARYLAQHHKLAQALALFDVQIKTDSLPKRQARMLYLKGSLLDQHGQSDRARNLYRQVMRRYPDQKEMTSNAQFSLGLSYVREKKPDSVREGISLLQDLFKQTKQPQKQRWMLHALTLSYQAVGNTAARYQTEEMLTQVGTPAQRLQSGLHLLEQDLGKLTYGQAMIRFDRLLHPGRSVASQVGDNVQQLGAHSVANANVSVAGDTTGAPGTSVSQNQSQTNTGVNWQMTSNVASDTAQVAGPASAGVQTLTQRQKRLQQSNGITVDRTLPPPLQSQMAFLHWRITCKRADRQKMLAEGNQYLKNYPKSPYAQWVRAKVKDMEEQANGGKK